MNVYRRRLPLKLPPEIARMVDPWTLHEPSAYTEVKRVVGDQVKVTVCCCAAVGATRKGCSIVAGNKTPCRCFCHSTETQEQARARRKAKGKR